MTPPAREPFDWRAFGRTFPFQPVPVWIVSAALLRPLSRATPLLLRATCAGPAREGVADLAFVCYSVVLPAAAALLVYLLAGRRRMTTRFRFMGDCCLALILLITSVNAFALVRSTRANWTTARPGLLALRAACWK